MTMMNWPPSTTEIRALRGARTQVQMAELAGLGSRERWAEYENGTTVPDRYRWEFMLLNLDLHPEWRLVRREVVQS